VQASWETLTAHLPNKVTSAEIVASVGTKMSLQSTIKSIKMFSMLIISIFAIVCFFLITGKTK